MVSSTGRTGDGVLDRSKEAYSEYVVGVFNEKTESRNIPSIIESGIALVKFDAANGSVQKGDYVTAASMPGYAMKAQQTGLMLGVAMEDSGSSGLLKIRVQPAWMKW